jgi:hypothetical protein
MTFEQVKTIMDRHAPALMELDGVVGVSIGALEDGAFVIQVMIRETNAALLDSIPDVIDGIPVRVEETGEIRPLGD